MMDAMGRAVTPKAATASTSATAAPMMRTVPTNQERDRTTSR